MKRKVLKVFRTLVLTISIFAFGLLQVSAEKTITFSHVGDRAGKGKNFPLFSQTDGTYSRMDIIDINATKQEVTISLTISNKQENGQDAPALRGAVEARLTLDKVIFDNFEVSVVSAKNDGVDTTAPTITAASAQIFWTIGDLDVEKIAVMTYVLKLKENFNRDILDTVLNSVNRGDISWTPGGSSTYFTIETDADCIPQFKITETENPKTDINMNYIITGIIGLGAISLVMYLNKKDKLVKI